MASLRPRLAGLAGAIAIVAGVLISSPAMAVAKSSYPAYSCWGGSIPGGKNGFVILQRAVKRDLYTVIPPEESSGKSVKAKAAKK